jgi:hypothetical protein
MPTLSADDDVVDVWAMLGYQLRADTPSAQIDGASFMVQIRHDAAYQAGTKAVDELEPETARTRTPALLTLLRSIEWRDAFRRVDVAWLKPYVVIGVLVAVGLAAARRLFFSGAYYIYLSAHVASGQSVSVVGDFNDWSPTPMRHQAGGSNIWETWVKVSPGRYRYRFVVDGSNYYVDSDRPGLVDADLGQGVSVLYVPSGGGPPTMGQTAGTSAAEHLAPAPAQPPR